MKFITDSLRQQEVFEVEVQRGANEHKDHQRKHQVLLDPASLYRAQVAAKPPSEFVRPIPYRLVDDQQVDIFADKRTDFVGRWTEEVQDTVNEALIHPFGDECFSNPA